MSSFGFSYWAFEFFADGFVAGHPLELRQMLDADGRHDFRMRRKFVVIVEVVHREQDRQLLFRYLQVVFFVGEFLDDRCQAFEYFALPVRGGIRVMRISHRCFAYFIAFLVNGANFASLRCKFRIV